MTERDAIAKMKRGDIEGLAFFVEKYQLKAVRTANLITRDRASAEDVVQATFIRTYQKIDQFDISRPFAPWFMRSVVNAAIQVSKHTKRQSVMSLDVSEHFDFENSLSNNMDDPLKQLEAKEQREQIRAALDELTPDQRAVIVMRYFMDMSEADMAIEADIPKGTIKWRLYSARQRLKGLLSSLINLKGGVNSG